MPHGERIRPQLVARSPKLSSIHLLLHASLRRQLCPLLPTDVPRLGSWKVREILPFRTDVHTGCGAHPASICSPQITTSGKSSGQLPRKPDTAACTPSRVVERGTLRTFRTCDRLGGGRRRLDHVHFGAIYGTQLHLTFVRFGVFTAVTMKNIVFWDMKPQFVLHRRHITSPLQSPAN
jgi:hypothetical protein